MLYAPPPGNAVNFNASTPYSAPAGAGFILNLGGIAVTISFSEWLRDQTAQRVLLVEAGVSIGGTETTKYLSTRGLATGATDTPANTPYLPYVAGGINLTEELSLDGDAGGMAFGDIELLNHSGALDDWLGSSYIWVNRAVRVYLGDTRWSRADFELVFDGVIADIDSKSRDRLSLKIRDKLQRLNTPISETKLGGASANADALIPVALGEVCNVAPLLTDPATHEYQYHTGASEGIIEVRDDGVPVSVTSTPATGKFTLAASPAGTITASAQGDKPSGVYSNTVAALVRRLATGYGKVSTRFTEDDLDTINLDAFDAAHPQTVGVYAQSRENCLAIIQQLAASLGAQAVISRTGKLQLLQIALPPGGAATAISPGDMVAGTLVPVQRTEVRAAAKIGYCKNWTAQANLQTGIPAAHKALFADEYLTASDSDGDVEADYKLDAEPVLRETFLLSKTDAEGEAARELALYSTPRTVFGFEGFAWLLELNLGDAVTITYPRFGLSSGKTGVVVKLAPDWFSARVYVEVLV